MSQLFKKNIIKDKLQSYEVPNFEEKIKILENWNNLYVSGNLQNKKEEELEAPFGDDFFGKILGYDSLTQNELYNRKFQPKVLQGGQKADLGLGFFSNTEDIMKVVIELKDAKTSLDKPQQRAGNLTPIQQAFKYKPYFKEVDFIIVSNFYETRLYIDSYYDYESFTLSDLVNPLDNYFNFRKFYYLLNKDNLISKKAESNTKSLLSLTRIQEKEITKQFYKEYTNLRKELFKDIVVNNPGFKKSELDFLLNKTQKIIDRIIFIHFCEDLGLLPEGRLKENVLRAEEFDFSPWEVLKKFFKGVDSGSEKLGIPNGYNGGLFHEDLELNNLKVGDNICKKFIDLGEYNFSDDLSVNILGHIFEQSISDIEELKDKINKQEEATLSKRKKDGVFYTPEYIVDYIVKNSVGKKVDEWEEKLKEKYNLKEDITDKNYNKRAISVYSELQEKVQNIKVLDPACGSGAFLVKVFDFLLEKNKEISKKLEDLSVNQGLFSSDTYFKSILQNNIYGVDLNEESVEITKLSLWLKTASKGKKLANLDSNIKCGNSLIDDKAIAGDKAFVWEDEFKEVFDNGGFDVIVGNPPYVRNERIKEIKPYLEKNYKTYIGTADLFVYFFEKSINALKDNGIYSIIVSNKFTRAGYGEKLREFILKNTRFIEYIDKFEEGKVFEDATLDPCIITLQKSKSNTNFLLKYNYENFINQNTLSSKSWAFGNLNILSILNKLNSYKKFINVIGEVKSGIKTGLNEVLIVSEEKMNQIISGNLKEKEVFVPFIKGQDIKKYNYKFDDNYLIYLEGKNLDDFPNVKSYLLNFKDKLESRSDIKGKNRKWYELRTCAYYDLFKSSKIIWPDISQGMNFTFDDSGNFLDMTAFFVSTNNKFYLSLLSSKLMEFVFKSIGSILGEKGFRLKKQYIHELPIPEIPLSQQTPFIEKADFMLDKNKELQEKTNKFLNRLKSSLGIEKFSQKLENFYLLTFADFVKELGKNKVKLSLKNQDEWEEYFDSYKKEILELKSQIDKCDKEIDEMVFDLYDLNEEERKVVLNIS